MLNPELRAQFQDIIDRYGRVSIFSLFGGGHHAALTLLRHPRPFDLVLPDQPQLPIEPGSDILPAGYVEGILMQLLPASLKSVIAIKRAFPDVRCTQVECPPPNGDDAWVLENIGEWFKQHMPPERLEHTTARLVRYKVWRIYSSVFRREVAKAGVDYLKCPAEGSDPDGFLKPEYFGGDATHASATYGRLVLDQIQREMGGKIVNWLAFG